MASYYPKGYANCKHPFESERLPLLRWMRRRKLAARRRVIEQYSGRTNGDLLDVGYAAGLFMNGLARAGWRVHRIEPIEVAAEFARHHYGFEIETGTLMQAPLEPGSFEVITFWDVIEHTFSPTGELAKSAQLLSTGGLLAITVPN